MALPSSSSAVVTSVDRPTRPTLARLDTSERIKAYDTVSTAAAAVRARQQAALSLSITPTSTPPSRRTQDGQADSLPTASTSFLAAEIAHLPRLHTSTQTLQNGKEAKRRDSEPPTDVTNTNDDPAAWSQPSPASSPMRTLSVSSGALSSATFEPSEIIKDFLYLGPDITTSSEAAYLRDQLGIRRILNAAWEIENGGGKHLRLDDGEGEFGFEGYLKLPIKDTVEEKGIQSFIEEACLFLDDARANQAPTYVHCKAGKSRSVMLVMAYLIHSNRWSLQRSYAHVVEQRRDVSPNIGFVAELMAFEEKKRKDQSANGKSGSRPEFIDELDPVISRARDPVAESSKETPRALFSDSPPPMSDAPTAGEVTPLVQSFATTDLQD